MPPLPSSSSSTATRSRTINRISREHTEVLEAGGEIAAPVASGVGKVYLVLSLSLPLLLVLVEGRMLPAEQEAREDTFDLRAPSAPLGSRH